MPHSPHELLIAAPLPDFLRRALEERYTCHPRDADPAHLARVRGVVPVGGTVLAPEWLARMPCLEIVAVMGVGVDGVPLAWCRERGVRVTHTPDVLTDDVADLAVALILMTARRLVEANRHVLADRWRQGAFPLARSLLGKRAGILGLGRIGKAIARRLETFGMHVAYHGRRRQDVSWLWFDDLACLAASSDFLVVACPGGPETYRLVDARVLSALGPNGTLINVARGSVVDEAALADALAKGGLGGYGSDVFADEPNISSGLLACERAVLLPHVGSATVETRQAMGDLVLRNLAAHFAGEGLVTPVA